MTSPESRSLKSFGRPRTNGYLKVYSRTISYLIIHAFNMGHVFGQYIYIYIPTIYIYIYHCRAPPSCLRCGTWFLTVGGCQKFGGSSHTIRHLYRLLVGHTSHLFGAHSISIIFRSGWTTRGPERRLGNEEVPSVVPVERFQSSGRGLAMVRGRPGELPNEEALGTLFIWSDVWGNRWLAFFLPHLAYR